jgi:hypothetical protein
MEPSHVATLFAGAAVLALALPARAFAFASRAPLRRYRPPPTLPPVGVTVHAMETAALAGVAIAASSAVAAGTAIYAGQQAAGAARAEAAQFAEEREAARVAAVQEEAAKRRQLTAALSATDNLRLGRGLDLMSGTGDAIRRESIEATEADIDTIGANSNRRQRRIGMSMGAALDRGDAAIMTSYGRAVGSLAGGASEIGSLMSRGAQGSRP